MTNLMVTFRNFAKESKKKKDACLLENKMLRVFKNVVENGRNSAGSRSVRYSPKKKIKIFRIFLRYSERHCVNALLYLSVPYILKVL